MGKLKRQIKRTLAQSPISDFVVLAVGPTIQANNHQIFLKQTPSCLQCVLSCEQAVWDMALDLAFYCIISCPKP